MRIRRFAYDGGKDRIIIIIILLYELRFITDDAKVYRVSIVPEFEAENIFLTRLINKI